MEKMQADDLLEKIVKIKFYNEDYKNIFEKLKDKIGKYPSLVFIDQFGIRYSNCVVELEKFNMTDFLIFVSSSSLKRFAGTREFKNALKLTNDEIKKFKNTSYKLIHEAVI